MIFPADSGFGRLKGCCSDICGVLNLWAFPSGLGLTMPKTEVPIFYRTFFCRRSSQRRGVPYPYNLPTIYRRFFKKGKTGKLCRAEGIERVEAIGAEPRNFWQENFVGRKIFRRLTSRLAATLQTVAVSEERRTGNDFSRRFRVRQIERLLLRNLRSPESVGIPVRARVGPPLGCVPLQLFGYFLRGTRQSRNDAVDLRCSTGARSVAPPTERRHSCRRWRSPKGITVPLGVGTRLHRLPQ